MKRKSLSFSQYLFFSVIAIYCVFVASFLYYQYHREKTHKVELLNSTLTMFNVDLYDHMADTAFSVPIKIFSKNPLTVHTVTNIITV